MLVSTGASAAGAAAEARARAARARGLQRSGRRRLLVRDGRGGGAVERPVRLAERLIGGMLAEARRGGSAVGMRVASAMRSMLQFRRGDLPDAESDARFVLSMADEVRRRRRVRHGWRTRRWRRSRSSAPRRDEALERLVVELDDPRVDADALPYRAVPLQPRLPARRARRRSRRARGLPHHREVRTRMGRGEPLDDAMAVGRSAGRQPPRPARARSHAGGQELELARGFGAPRALGIALRAEALVAADGTTESLLAEAVAVLEVSGARLEHARALIDLGTVLRRDGRRDQARELLRRGLEIAARCGADRLAERGRDELLATGARPRRIALSGVESLTPSERHAAELAADGHRRPGDRASAVRHREDGRGPSATTRSTSSASVHARACARRWATRRRRRRPIPARRARPRARPARSPRGPKGSRPRAIRPSATAPRCT